MPRKSTKGKKLNVYTLAQRRKYGAGTELLLGLLQRSGWSVTRAVEMDGTLGRHQFYRLIKSLGLYDRWLNRKAEPEYRP